MPATQQCQRFGLAAQEFGMASDGSAGSDREATLCEVKHDGERPTLIDA